MSTTDIKTVEGYVNLLAHLSQEQKLMLIEKLVQSMQKPKEPKPQSTRDAFGAWEGEETADELIEMIRSSRTINPDREPL